MNKGLFVGVGLLGLFLVWPRKAAAAVPAKPPDYVGPGGVQKPKPAQPAQPAQPAKPAPAPPPPASANPDLPKSAPLTDIDKAYVVYGTLDDAYNYAQQSNNPIVWQAAAQLLAEAGDLRAQALAAKIAAAT